MTSKLIWHLAQYRWTLSSTLLTKFHSVCRPHSGHRRLWPGPGRSGLHPHGAGQLGPWPGRRRVGGGPLGLDEPAAEGLWELVVDRVGPVSGCGPRGSARSPGLTRCPFAELCGCLSWPTASPRCTQIQHAAHCAALYRGPAVDRGRLFKDAPMFLLFVANLICYSVKRDICLPSLFTMDAPFLSGTQNWGSLQAHCSHSSTTKPPTPTRTLLVCKQRMRSAACLVKLYTCSWTQKRTFSPHRTPYFCCYQNNSVDDDPNLSECYETFMLWLCECQLWNIWCFQKFCFTEICWNITMRTEAYALARALVWSDYNAT